MSGIQQHVAHLVLTRVSSDYHNHYEIHQSAVAPDDPDFEKRSIIIGRESILSTSTFSASKAETRARTAMQNCSNVLGMIGCSVIMHG